MHAPTLRTSSSVSSSVSFSPGVHSAPTGGGNPSPNYDPATTLAPPQPWPTLPKEGLLMRALNFVILTATSVCAVSLSACGSAAPAPAPAAALS